MGHQNAGVITEVGEGMDQWKVGDRVGLAPVMSDGDALGYGKWDGGFGPSLLATNDNLVKLPDEVSFKLGSMATDAGLTAYHAIMAVGGAKAGMKVGVIGLGGLGYIGARVAALSGAEVYGAEVNPETRELAEFGTFVQVGMGRLEATINTYPVEPADQPDHPGRHPRRDRQAPHRRRRRPLRRYLRLSRRLRVNRRHPKRPVIRTPRARMAGLPVVYPATVYPATASTCTASRSAWCAAATLGWARNR
jgi:hypothetical protein